MKKILTQISVTIILGLGISANAAVTGQWDFNSGDLSATTGTDLAYRGDTAASTIFTTATIGGNSANVMNFPATTPTQGYTMTHGMAPNGGGSFVNQWSLIMDIMYPTASSGAWRALLQTNEGNGNDGDLFVNPGNGIGTGGQYAGAIVADTWHRVAFVFDLTLGPGLQLRKFIDGSLVGTQSAGSLDGQFGLDPTALLFTDEDNETKAGFVNSIQIHDAVLSDSYIGGLGGATAAGIPAVPEPASGLLLVAGLAVVAARGYRKNR
jgi:hypothetical protein